MKCICIAGASQIGLLNVADILAKAGMMPPRSSNRADFVDMQSWHEQALSLTTEEDFVAPGRFMEQLAGDIFSANTKANLWGWADTRSTWLLDFWLGFDPRLYFVLVYVSPELMLTHAISSETEIDSVAVIMEDWQTYNQQLLRFHLRNPGRSLLVDASECIENPQAFVNACTKQWKLQIDTSTIHDFTSVPQDAMAYYLARQLCRDFPQTASLHHELVATMTRLGEVKQTDSSASLSSEQVIASFHFLRDKSDELKLLQAVRDELSALEADFDVALANHARQQEEMAAQLQHAMKHNETQQTVLSTLLREKEILTEQCSSLEQDVAALGRVRDQQAKLTSEQQEKIAQLTGQHEETVVSHLQQRKELERDNELLLANLHQVQCELEVSIPKLEATEALNDTLQRKQVALEAEKAALVDQRTVLDQKLVTHVQERKVIERDYELRLANLHQIKCDLEVTVPKLEATQTLNDTLQRKLATLEKEKTAFADQRILLDQKLAGHLQQRKEIEQENELILLQLQQVQEELEHYFLQCEDKQKELQNAENRWQNMLRRNPDYCDCDSIEMVSSDNAIGSTVHWRLKNLSTAGQSWSDLEFRTIVDLDMAGFVFDGQSANSVSLTRWPINAINQSELTIIPVGSGEVQQQRHETLLNLAISDWDLLRALPRLLERTLKQSPSDIIPTGFNVQPLLSGLIRLEEVIENFPEVLRFDRVSLRNEQVNPDYEHLWLHFDNLALGNKRYQDFEFRLSCGNVRPQHFGAYPKLEFPEVSGQAPFEAWFIEAHDDFGAKLELRFALPESMDLDVLHRLTESDRDFLFALIARLPAILATLQNTGAQLKRSWDDWINLANKIEQIYRLRTEKQSAPTAQSLSVEIAQTSIETVVSKPEQHRTTPTKTRRKKR